MAGNDELFKALEMFSSGVQSLQLSRAINSANEKVQQIKTMETDDAKQRVALQETANQLALQMHALGAPVSQIQSAAGFVGPKQFATNDQAALEANLTNNQSMRQRVMQADTDTNANRLQMQHDAQAHDLKKQSRDIAHRERLAMLELAAKGDKERKGGEVSFDTNVGMAQDLIKQLRSTIKKDGTYESRFGNEDSAAKLDAIPYQLAITYAKIVDPESVAREGEVAAAQKYMITTGATASDAVALKQLAHMEKTIMTYQKKRRAATSTAPAPAPSGAGLDPAQNSSSAPAWMKYIKR